MSELSAGVHVADEPYTGQPLKKGHESPEKKKDSVVRDIFILVLITLVAGFLLGAAYTITKEPIARAQAQTRAQAQKTVMQAGETFETIYSSDGAGETGPDGTLAQDVAKALADTGLTATEVTKIDEAYDAGGTFAGYVVTATNSEGYGGDVELMCGITPENGGALKLEGIYFLTLTETAGMGMRAQDEEFISQFEGKTIEPGEMLVYTKNGASAGNEIDAISGCTVTTSAVTKDVNAAIVAVRCAEARK